MLTQRPSGDRTKHTAGGNSRALPGGLARAALAATFWLAALAGGCCNCPAEQPGRPPPRALAPGQSAVVTVYACKHWNPSGLLLVDAAEYEFDVEGEQHWHEAGITCTADGYDRFWLRSARGLQRYPCVDLFTLIGNVGRDPGRSFVIGTSARYTARGGGELFCFADDVSFMYWNNSGKRAPDGPPHEMRRRVPRGATDGPWNTSLRK